MTRHQHRGKKTPSRGNFARALLFAATMAVLMIWPGCLLQNQAIKAGVRLTTCRLDSFTEKGKAPDGTPFTADEMKLRLQTYAELRSLAGVTDCEGVAP
jgi:hypothetical protein